KAEIESAQREETQAPTHTAAVGKNADAGAPKSTSTVDLRPSTIDHRPSTIDHRPSTIDHRPSTSTSKADGGVQ
ncbi:MAG: hypothetical protein ACREJX_18330, partial [Polyangiaceae bacterium]